MIPTRWPTLAVLLTLTALGVSAAARGQAPTAKPGTAQPPHVVAAALDREIDRLLAENKVPASPQTDDAEFIRRITIDLLGRVPLGERVETFLDGKATDRRQRLIDELLDHPEYGRQFGILWHNRIIPLSAENQREFKRPLFLWLAEGFNRNRPWSETVAQLLLAEGEVAKTPALNFYLSPANTVEGYVHADRVAGSVAELFLGANLRCAQCHDHPFAHWKQTEFWETAAFFGRVGFRKKTGEKQLVEAKDVMARGGNQSPTARPDASLPIPGKNKVVKARFLGGELAPLDPEQPFRPAFVKWLTSPENERFAAASVNRLWHHFFGRGLVNPVNDMHDGNPSAHPEVLRLLRQEFVNSGFDQKHLIRCITNSRAYQRTSRPLAGNKGDQKWYSHVTLRQMSGEVLFDSLFMILDGARYDKDLLKSVTNAGRDHWLRLLSDSHADIDPTRYTHGVPQALLLLNSHLPNGGEVPLIRKLLREKATPERALEVLYLEALARRPTVAERAVFAEFLREFRDPMTAYRNVWWVLLNGSEFVFNH